MVRIKLLSIVLLLLYGCGDNTPETPPGRNEKFQFNSEVYHNHLKVVFAADADTITAASLSYRDTLYLYYLKNSFNPVLIKSFEEEGLVISLLEILKAAGEHGLNPEWYHTTEIENQFVSAVSGDSVNAARYEHLANAEVLAADAIIKYSWHLKYGVVNPKEIYPDSYYLPVKDSTGRDLFEPLKQSDVIAYLKRIQPKDKRYTDLQAALSYYEKFDTLQLDPIPIPSEKIEPGGQSPVITSVRERLIDLNYADSAIITDPAANTYDSLLIEPVKEFQRLNGLIDDGIIGKGTVEKLNTPLSDYIKKIKLNLERFRWNSYADSSRYLLINIPDFHLYAIEEGKEVLNIKVCTGRKRNAGFEERMAQYLKTRRGVKPDDWETPEMTGEISFLILNPTWTVPSSIIREEIAGGVRKDSTYLLRKNFKVYKNGTSVDPASISSQEFLRNTTQYRVVQDPGAGNALGKMKFMFNNPFGIYLHDTPTRAPFGKSNRAVSHGCVRLEKPLTLADYVLRSNSKWNTDYIKLEIGQQVEDKNVKDEFYRIRNSLRANSSYGKTTEVKLFNKIRLMVDYYTAWVDKDGKINFRDDVYRKDEMLAAKLFPESKLEKVLAVN